MRSLFRPRTPPQIMRRRFERFGGTSRAAVLARHPSVVFGDHRVGELAIESIRATPRPGSVLLYLHGGAFVMGSPNTYRSRAVRLSYRCDAEVLVPDYRLAPEHPFPAALEDALAAWHALGSIAPGRPALVGGDSAGGGLALSLMVQLRELGEPSPGGAVLISPSANLAGGAVSSRHRDLWLSTDHLRRWRRHYLGTAIRATHACRRPSPTSPGFLPCWCWWARTRCSPRRPIAGWLARETPEPMRACWSGRDAARLAPHPSLARRELPRLGGDCRLPSRNEPTSSLAPRTRSGTSPSNRRGRARRKEPCHEAGGVCAVRNRLLRGVDGDAPLRGRLRGGRSGPPDHRYRGAIVTARQGAARRCAAARPLRGPAQRNGTARIQGGVDTGRPETDRAKHLRPGLECLPRRALSALATDSGGRVERPGAGGSGRGPCPLGLRVDLRAVLDPSAEPLRAVRAPAGLSRGEEEGSSPLSSSGPLGSTSGSATRSISGSSSRSGPYRR